MSDGGRDGDGATSGRRGGRTMGGDWGVRAASAETFFCKAILAAAIGSTKVMRLGSANVVARLIIFELRAENRTLRLGLRFAIWERAGVG